MSLKSKIRQIVKNNDKLYVIGRCICNLHDTDFVRLLRGYYDHPHDYTSILAMHNGMKYPDRVVYHIKIYNTIEKEAIAEFRGRSFGFAAALYWTLKEMIFADFLQMTPVVEWGNSAAYYDSGMDQITMNTFEYYFEPVSRIDYRDVDFCRNVIKGNIGHGYFITKQYNGYDMQQDEIEELGNIYKKYVHLNHETKNYIEDQVHNMLDGKKVLAVHARGTDFNMGYRDHPMVVAPDEYLTKAKVIFSLGEYDKIFLATDDANILQLFEREFKDRLSYYTDVIRVEGQVVPFAVYNSRPLHYYKLGLEVLRDIYTLANCESLICSKSGVAFVARYINFALGRCFKELAILDKGLNKKEF